MSKHQPLTFCSLRSAQLKTLRLLIVLLAAALAAPLAADIGQVTVDDELLDDALFAQRTIRLSARRICPPVSDDRIREHVVMLHLLVREGNRLGLKIVGADALGEEDALTALERIPTNATPQRRAQLEFDLLKQRGTSYRTLLIGEIGDDEITARYPRAIEQKHPELVNVVLLRYTMHNFGTEEARTLALRELEDGNTYEQLVAANKFGDFDEYDDEEWRFLERWVQIEPVIGTLAPGDIAVSTNFRASVLHVTDTKVLSRIRPHQRINGDELHAWRTVLHIISRERQQALETRLRQDAVVREDGIRVFARENYPEC